MRSSLEKTRIFTCHIILRLPRAGGGEREERARGSWGSCHWKPLATQARDAVPWGQPSSYPPEGWGPASCVAWAGISPAQMIPAEAHPPGARTP